MADDNWKKLTWSMIEAVENRITALESRKCNCSVASSAGAGPGSYATGGSISSAPTTTSASSANSGSSDPVSAAIRDARESAMRAAVEREPVWTKQAGETAWKRWQDYRSVGALADPVQYRKDFNAFVASEVAAAKAKPHAETAQEVAKSIIVGWGSSVVHHPHLHRLITAAIKRERGEA